MEHPSEFSPYAGKTAARHGTPNCPGSERTKKTGWPVSQPVSEQLWRSQILCRYVVLRERSARAALPASYLCANMPAYDVAGDGRNVSTANPMTGRPVNVVDVAETPAGPVLR